MHILFLFCRLFADLVIVFVYVAGGPSFVFKSSKTLLNMALDMDMESDGVLSKEVCFADGNHKRCPGYITLTLWVSLIILTSVCSCLSGCVHSC